MPELPEVNTIKNQIAEYLPLTITHVETFTHTKSIVEVKNFDPTGMSLSEIHRHGKMLKMFFGAKHLILSHLGMSGSWRIAKVPIKEKHLHLQLHCKNDSGENVYLGYIDPRRFGFMKWIEAKDLKEHTKTLGVDIGSPEFTLNYLISAIKRFPERKLKVTLLDQKLFAGCGNYIASEICALAGIRPTRLCKKITKHEEFKQLLQATQTVLEQSINKGGTTFSGGYQDAFGEKGEGVANLVVFYQKICRLCNVAKVKKITLAGRGTYYCPNCQK